MLQLLFAVPAQCPYLSPFTGYMTHLRWLLSLPCWHPSGTSSLVLVGRLSCVLQGSWNLTPISPTFHFQTWHADWSLADQTISCVGPQTGGLFCGGEHGETTEGAGVPRERSASAHLHGSWEPDHSAVRHCFPPNEKCLRRRQRIGAPARFLWLRWSAASPFSPLCH